MRKRYGVIVVALALAGVAFVSAREAAPRDGNSAALVPTARSDYGSKPDRAGDVKAKGLTARERGAIDIVRVDADGDAFATVVTVTFAGSFEAAAGRGRLAGAVAAVVLTPARGQPTVVATRGPGVGETVAGLGGRGPFAVFRDGRRVNFVARRFDHTKATRIEVKTFSALGQARRATQGASQDDPLNPIARYLRSLRDTPIMVSSDYTTFKRTEVKRGDCERLRRNVAFYQESLDEAIPELNRARAQDRKKDAAELGRVALRFAELVRYYEARLKEECPPPAEDYGCQARVEKHPTAAGHHNIGLGLCKRTVDRVEMETSAPFQRVDQQGIVVHTTANTFRIVPVGVLSDHELVVAIQPPMQPVEFLQVTVQGLTSGTRVEITPSSEGKQGRTSVVTTP